MEVRLRHTANAGVVNFRFQFDPSIVAFVSSRWQAALMRPCR